jgi:hypothetical protein
MRVSRTAILAILTTLLASPSSATWLYSCHQAYAFPPTSTCKLVVIDSDTGFVATTQIVLPGWSEMAFDRAGRRLFYPTATEEVRAFNLVTKEDTVFGMGPAGWQLHFDPDTGRVFTFDADRDGEFRSYGPAPTLRIRVDAPVFRVFSTIAADGRTVWSFHEEGCTFQCTPQRKLVSIDTRSGAVSTMSLGYEFTPISLHHDPTIGLMGLGYREGMGVYSINSINTQTGATTLLISLAEVPGIASDSQGETYEPSTRRLYFVVHRSIERKTYLVTADLNAGTTKYVPLPAGWYLFLHATDPPTEIPAVSSWILVAMAVALAAIGLIAARP